MEKVDAYKTEDGKIFTSEIEAINHETTIRLNLELMEVVESIYSYDMSREEVCDALKENSKKLARILGEIAENSK
jgi:hypothetical protein